jgi:glycosyltransferase involved in cell wall biosynthesis
MVSTLGLTVITKNEEKNIERCLGSVPFAQTKVVVDSLSTDRTVELANQLGAQVILREWQGFAKQKQFAFEQIEEDWILVLDADESLTESAQEEIKTIIQNNQSCDAYRIPIYPVFMGRILKYGKGPSFPVRLIKKGKGSYTSREVHEEIIVKGTCGQLKNGVRHDSSLDVMSRYEKIKRDILLEKQYVTGAKIGAMTLFGDPIRYFFSYLIKRQAWKDGIPGVVWLVLFTIQMFLQNAIQYEQSLTKNSL